MIIQKIRRKGSLLILVTLISTGLISCDRQAATDSNISVVNIPQTSVKWQSIGNCWAYATLGWVESLVLAGRGLEMDFSESYHTYRHFELQLANPRLEALESGGSWRTSMNILRRFGLMDEAAFIPEEATKAKSQRQAEAEKYLNQSLKSGLLSVSRSAETIRSELDAAFGVELAAVENLIIYPDDLVLSFTNTGVKTLASELNWREISYLDFTGPTDAAELPAMPSAMSPRNQDLLYRVKQALNDGHPVVMNWFVDFNAMDNNGIFSLENLMAKGPGSQGYHQTVIIDYVVEGVDPLTGEAFFIPEGEASLAEKQLALEHGKIVYFVVKNSWGGDDRLDRSSYRRDGSAGYHRLDASYLFGHIPQTENGNFQGSTTGLNAFIIPMGY